MSSENALAPVQHQTENGYALTEVAHESAATSEVQGAMLLAKRFPRNEDACFSRSMTSCQRRSFADKAMYSFPRGGSKITGPSVSLARDLARIWGHMRWGVHVIAESETDRTIRAWAWDVEANNKVEADDCFKKLIFRKNKGGEGGRWIEPDERELRELSNRRGALAVRNCLLQLLPKDLVEDACAECQKTMEKEFGADPASTRKAVVKAFAAIGVAVERLEDYLGHPLSECSPNEITDLRKVYKSISDGQSTWADYATSNERDAAAWPVTADGLKAKMRQEQEARKAGQGGPKSATQEQRAMITALAIDKAIQADQLKGIISEYADSMETLTQLGANEVISVLKSIGDAAE